MLKYLVVKLSQNWSKLSIAIDKQSILLSLFTIDRSNIIYQLNSYIWVVAAYKRTISNSKTVLNFCKKIGYGYLTKLVYTPRIH